MKSEIQKSQHCPACDKQIASFFKTCPFCQNNIAKPLVTERSFEPVKPLVKESAGEPVEEAINPWTGAADKPKVKKKERYRYKPLRPTEDEASVSDMLTSFIVLVVIVFLLYQCVSDDEPSRPVELTADQIEKRNEYKALGNVRYQITSRLRDPDSYDVIDQGALTKSDGSIAVVISYRAKNGFGGYTVNHAAYTCQPGRSSVSCTEVR